MCGTFSGIGLPKDRAVFVLNWTLLVNFNLLDHKLRTLDRHYLELSENFNGKLTFEEKIIAHQAKLEAKSKAELEKKVSFAKISGNKF